MTENMVSIPAGPFLMGSSDADVMAWDNERPQRTVYLPEYHIGKYPVTNAQYAAFVQATGHVTPDHWEDGRVPAGLENHPVVNVTWHKALDYCRWLTAQLRERGGIELDEEVTLPTEAQWEKAARGTDGRIYPWGDEFDAAKCNMYDTGIGTTTPVGSYPAGASPYGVLDMAGNMWEWCRTKWRDNYEEPADESLGGDARRVVRGGVFGFQRLVRCAYRNFGGPDGISGFCGFRVVVAPDTSGLMVRDKLAAYSHEVWASWMKYLFEKSARHPDGSVTIPAWAVARWERQSQIPYAELPEDEKKSDLVEADHMLKILIVKD